MKKAPLNMIYEAASRDNILALTSRCATSCVFCSHHQNPPDVEAFFVSDLNFDEAVMAMEFLSEDRKIIIGESATRLCEGEPFIYKDFTRILRMIRGKYKKTPIQITTSGIHLDEQTLQILKSIGGIELNISLNSCTKEGREKLFNGKSLMEAVDALSNISHYGIPFSGSIVAMPHVVGEKDVEDTIRFLSKSGAQTIRIFTPGYTKYSRIANPPDDMGNILKVLVSRTRNEIDTPILLEPAMLKELTPVLEGVIHDSPAHRAGLRSGDVILKINGKHVFSRVDAYYKAFSAKKPEIEYMTGDKTKVAVLDKEAKTRSGLVVNYDIDIKTVDAIKASIQRNNGKSCLLLTSQFACEIMVLCLMHENIDIEAVENSFFGGNIGCCGLLVLEDIERKLKESSYSYDVVFLPSVMFDVRGRDLTGKHYKDLEQESGINIEVI